LLVCCNLKTNQFCNWYVDHFFKPVLPDADPVLQISYFLVVACYVVFHIGQRGCNFILTTLSYIIHVTTLHNGISGQLSQRDQKLGSDFVSDVRTPTEHFNIEGKCTVYAICPNPKCHRSYKLSFDLDCPIPQYPSHCNASPFPGEVCNKTLLHPKRIGNNTISAPIKTFVYFDFKDWLAGLLSHPGFKERMDNVWQNHVKDGQQEMRDIFDGDLLRNFIGGDGKAFGASTAGEYVFSLNVDFFNPNGNKAAGKSFSCGIMSMVCLNLLPDLRYQPENMYLAGIIPGPAEPPTACINNYIRPLVDDLLNFWYPGVQFSRTHQFCQGQTVACALVAIVCNLPASRKVAGFASHSHEFFCSLCYCTQKKDGYGTTMYESWLRRSGADCRSYTEKWWNTSNTTATKAVFNKHGLWWSELLRLPYFDPSQFVIIDAMHNLFLGLINFHFCDILGYCSPTIKNQQQEPAISLNVSDGWKEFNECEQKSVKKLQKDLESHVANEMETNRQKWEKKFATYHVKALSFICNELNLISQSMEDVQKLAEQDYIERLINWVCTLHHVILPSTNSGSL
jgi:hypothetical protein